MQLLLRLSREPLLSLRCLNSYHHNYKWSLIRKLSKDTSSIDITDDDWATESLKRATTPITLEEIDPSLDEKSPNQAPNRATTWSRRQQSRKAAYKLGPRFTGIELEAQPQPLGAIELLKEEPIAMVSARKVSCDGGGALGHPVVYINLDDSSTPQSCGYCGRRFQQASGGVHH